MIVVGAGIIGLACARRLRRRGFRVTIFDAREPGREASWAGAGMLAPGGEIESDSELAALATRSLGAWPEFARELEEETGASIDFQRCGAFEIAETREEYEALCARAERQRAIGIESEPVKYTNLEARFYPGDAIVDPRRVTAALVKACAQAACTIRAGEPIVEVARDGAWVRTPGGKISDEDGVLIAAGAWSSWICGALPATKPVRGHLAAWNLKPGALPSIVRRCHTYLLQRAGGTLIAGSSTEEAGFEREIDRAIVADIQRRAAKLLPVLARMEPADCWNGFRPAIVSQTGATCPPLIGRVGDRLWAATGHYRNGILLAPETARMIEQTVAEIAENSGR